VSITQAAGGTRSPSRSPWRVKRILVSVGMICGAAALFAFAANSGGSLDEPVGFRVYEIGITAAALGLLSVGIWQTVQLGRPSLLLLMSVSAGTAFWQETYGDWGAYCLYSARFLTYDWGHTVWSAPVRCWWFIAGYMVFYTSFFLGLIAAVRFARNRWPSANPYITAALVSLPAFYVFDLVWEGTTTGLGYWSYTYTFGPAMHVGHGTFPLLWPILEQVPFMALAAFALTWRNSRGEDVFEVAAGFVLRRCPGQIAILTSWIVILNIAFLTTTILPIMALRWIAGPASSAMP
jgi:Spirocyclase AveC-like